MSEHRSIEYFTGMLKELKDAEGMKGIIEKHIKDEEKLKEFLLKLGHTLAKYNAHMPGEDFTMLRLRDVKFILKVLERNPDHVNGDLRKLGFMMELGEDAKKEFERIRTNADLDLSTERWNHPETVEARDWYKKEGQKELVRYLLRKVFPDKSPGGIENLIKTSTSEKLKELKLKAYGQLTPDERKEAYLLEIRGHSSDELEKKAALKIRNGILRTIDGMREKKELTKSERAVRIQKYLDSYFGKPLLKEIRISKR